MNKLSIADLLENSSTYDQMHTITQADASKATELHRRIIASRNPDKPMPGDIMICQGRSAEYLSGHIAYENLAKIASVCVQPYVPFVSMFCCKQDEVSFDTSGGYWFSILKKHIADVALVGQRDKLFKAWGHCGACKDGAFTFSCPVNVWSYYSDDIY